jgi:hypothetical protein
MTIKAHPQNPHYFMYQGKPILLISSDHAYGAIVTKDFDYRIFLDTLAFYGMNFTRIYPGATPPSWFARPTIFPWLKTESGKYDLDQWDEEYFGRLKDFVWYAQQMGIIVDVCLFNGEGGNYYPESLASTPLNPTNNLQNEGSPDEYAYTSAFRCPALVEREESYVRKIGSELLEFENVVYDLCDEPNIGRPELGVEEFTPWIERMLNALLSVDKKHLVAETHAGTICDGVDWRADPRITWISLEYHMGIGYLDSDYRYNKPLACIETACFPIHYEDDILGAARAEAWEFLVGGGAGFIQFSCDYSFNHYGFHFPINPSASGTQTLDVLAQKKILKQFMESFDFIKMSPIVVQGIPGSAYSRAIAEAGRQYAFYIHHSQTLHMGAYQAIPGEYQEEIIFCDVPPGTYIAQWIQPATGEVVRVDRLIHRGMDLQISTPGYSFDLALRMIIDG